MDASQSQATTANDEARRRHLRSFQNFLDGDLGKGKYATRINDVVANKRDRLVITVDDLKQYDADLCQKVINEPVEYLTLLEEAVNTHMKLVHAAYMTKQKTIYVALDGHFGANHVTPRGLSASLLGQVICLEGITTKCYEVKAKVLESVHYTPATGKQVKRAYTDLGSLSGKRTTSTYPTTDADGNALVTEFGLSEYQDHQQITLQEMPERAPAGQLPRSIDILLYNSLVDSVKPGDRVRITGVYRLFPNKKNGMTSGKFNTALLAVNVEKILRVGTASKVTPTEIRTMRKLAEDKKVSIVNRLAQSMAPSIYGHSWIKRALLCQLLGGVEKNLENGTHLRGDINILMVGDPSTAKSQALRFMLNTATVAIATTGRGSSGVGLTAAVLTDMETGEKRLEAGAMVLADRGVVCIDEFDKMSDADRVAIHEVMEQQTVTINKAAIHTTLNARCSVLAAANPIYGQYDPNVSTMENVGLPDSLLSRFDLLFIVLDNIDPVTDRKISEHVLRNHTYRNPNERDGYVNPSFILGQADVAGMVDNHEEKGDDRSNEIYVKHNPNLHGPLKSKKDRMFNLTFLKKYIHYAKVKINPTLTTEATQYIVGEYTQLRENRREKSLPITARTLETMIRLATAMARCRLSQEVTKKDAKEGVDILKFALYAEEPDAEDDGLTYDNMENRKDDAEKKEEKRKRREKRARRKAEGLDFESSGDDLSSDSEDEDDDDDDFSGTQEPGATGSKSDKTRSSAAAQKRAAETSVDDLDSKGKRAKTSTDSSQSQAPSSSSASASSTQQSHDASQASSSGTVNIPKKAAKKPAKPEKMDEGELLELSVDPTARERVPGTVMNAARKAAFRLSLNELMNEEAEDGTYNKQEIKNKLLAGNFTLAEIDTMLVSLMADNSIFMTDDTIMRI